jgi:sporadic carbohydrate cluster 2OG-Fe(II) oxygenase
MALTDTFRLAKDGPDGEEFLRTAYVIRDVEDREALDGLRREIVLAAARLINHPAPADDGAFLDEIHRLVPVEKVNDLRLGLYREINGRKWFRPTYFRLVRGLIESLVGNELAMQNRINFSIQMPEDRSSLLDLHADVFAGETPYQVVQWLPLVDVRATKSMFILERPKSDKVCERLKDFSDGGMSALFEVVKPDLRWLDIPYGKVLVFSPNVLHGNVINEEATSRWSLNCRYTGLFTPYGIGERSLGSYYSPITARPVTRIGMAYRQPGGFEE